MSSQATEFINIKVSEEVAQRYKKSSIEQQSTVAALIEYWLKEPTTTEREKAISSLENTARQASKEAKAKGMTPEILENILNESS